MVYCNFQMAGCTIFLKGEMRVKYYIKLHIAVLHTSFSRLQTSVFSTNPPKKLTHHKGFNVFFNENENNDIKMIFSSNVAEHIAIVISVRITAIIFFFKILQR